MQEFNYARAWSEWIRVEFDKAMGMPEFQDAWNAVVNLSPDITQCQHSLNRLKLDTSTDDKAMEPPTEMIDLMKEIGDVELYRLGMVVNAYGHWHPGKDAPQTCSATAGATWKFEKFANQLVFNDVAGEEFHQVKVAFEQKTKEFYDHKPGTEYSDDEAVKLLTGASRVRPVRHTAVNFRVTGYHGDPHPFVIGQKHLQNSDGMYLDPNCAPCDRCKFPYSAHHHDMVVLVDGTMELSNAELHTELKKLLDFIEEHNVKNPKDQVRVDGFGLYDRKK